MLSANETLIPHGDSESHEAHSEHSAWTFHLVAVAFLCSVRLTNTVRCPVSLASSLTLPHAVSRPPFVNDSQPFSPQEKDHVDVRCRNRPAGWDSDWRNV